MSQVWGLLALVVAVGAGLVTVTVASVLVRSRQTALFRYLLIQNLLFNLLILAGLLTQYLAIQIRDAGTAAHPMLIPALLMAMAPVKLAWLYAFAAMMLVLPGQELPDRFVSRYFAFPAALLGSWWVLGAIQLLRRSAGTLLDVLVGSVEVATIGGAIAACVHLLIRTRSLVDGPRRRSISILGSAYLGVFAVMTASLAVDWLRRREPPGNRLLLNGLVMVFYNLLPLVWLLRFQPMGPLPEAGAMERYGISPREREIIGLICGGCTNQEVAERLFISPSTVKDHAYNIFRKTGVRNRVELANLMRAKAGPDGETSL